MAPGLTVPSNPEIELRPSNRPSTLSAQMENAILDELSCFEKPLGSSLITSVLMESLATMQIISKLFTTTEVLNYNTEGRKVNSNCALTGVLNQMKTVQ